MAAQWSSEQFVAEYKDLQASAMGVDCLGQWALLAGRKALALVNLNNTQNVVKVARKSKWEIGCVQWNPHASHAANFVTASNHRLDVLTWNGSKTDHICNLKAHSRTVCDVDWSPFDVNVIASCSVDTFSYLWDIREPKKPVASFQTVAGAYQVKWNKVRCNQFATTHEGDLRVWDPRKGNMPLTYIAAHLSKIHGLDWSPSSQDHLVTASQDCSVRFWNWRNAQRSEGIISLKDVPVWRARYTPFGNGLITGVVPQLRRGENSLYLWNIDNHTQPLHAFMGHKDVVLDFQWRKQAPGEVDHQLVTWSRDQSLRIWRIDPALQKLCGHHVQEAETTPLPSPLINRSGNDINKSSPSLVDDQMAISSTNSQKLQSLINEFSLINTIQNVTIEWMDAVYRKCLVRAVSGKRSVVLSLTFPDAYPYGEAPVFEFVETTLDPGMEKKLMKVLKETSLKHVLSNMICLEPCLRNLIQALDSLTYEERRTPESDVPYDFTVQPSVKPKIYKPLNNGPTYSSFQDSYVPFPRTCGASFCSAGCLVVFKRPADLKKSNASEITPKTLSDMVEYNSHNRMKPPQSQTPYVAVFSCSPPPPTAPPEYAVANFYTYKEKKHRTRSRSSRHRESSESSRRDSEKTPKEKDKLGLVRLYDVSNLLAIHKQLAEKYILDISNIDKMCANNASVASVVGRKDLVQLWSLAARIHAPTVAEQNQENNLYLEPPWAMHPFGRKFLEELINHYLKIQDIQTVAMLCCMFWVKEKAVKPQRSVSKTSMEYIPANTDVGINYMYLGSSADSGWNILQGTLHIPSLAQAATAPLSAVASHPNLAALFKQAMVKNKRSNSWSDSYDDFRIIEDDLEEPVDHERLQYELDSRMLDPNKIGIYDEYKLAYAKILYQWGLINQSALIMKFISFPTQPEKNYEFPVYCYQCNHITDIPQCINNHIALKCSICRTGVKDSANICLSCGHGGHTQHIIDWFQTETECPTGCGCHCLLENPMIEGW